MFELLLGLIGWMIPFIAMGRWSNQQKRNNVNFVAYTVLLSMAACSLAIWITLRYQGKLLASNDISAMQDILPSAIKAALFLLLSTLCLNLYFIYFTQKTNISS